MQTVVMSFGRNLYLGKPDLPIGHVHVYFPVQVVHKIGGALLHPAPPRCYPTEGAKVQAQQRTK